MNRSRDWRRAQTFRRWARRDAMALFNRGVRAGNIDAGSPVWRETPCRCSCWMCREARRRMAQAPDWRAEYSGGDDADA